MPCPTDPYIAKALRLCRELAALADEGELHADEDGCRLLFGEIRDCAFRIRAKALEEREAHREREDWDVLEPG